MTPHLRSFCRACTVVLAATVAAFMSPARSAEVDAEADTALILAVDVSESVDAVRYRLQMEGIAQALEDEGVINAIISGPKGGILLSMVTWADKAGLSLPWQMVRSAEDARRVAGAIREIPQQKGEYTCLSRMLAMVKESVVPSVPAGATRIVLDVSGDGIDNCQKPEVSAGERDELLAMGLAINGLPIIVKGENDVVGSGAYRAPGFDLSGEPLGPGGRYQTTLDAWYRNYVIGGPGAFLLAAHGFEDFGRAFRQKFVTEVSAAQ